MTCYMCLFAYLLSLSTDQNVFLLGQSQSVLFTTLFSTYYNAWYIVDDQ